MILKKYVSRAAKVVIFVTIFATMFVNIFGHRAILKMGTDVTNMPYYNSFYDLPDNSIDGIILGNSVAARGWNDVEAYHNSGMTVYSLATESQPVAMMKYIIEEALKTQDLKFVIIEVHGMRSNVFYSPYESFIRRITDCMPMSKNRMAAVKAGYEYYQKATDYRVNVLGKTENEKNGVEEAPLYLPFIKYHSRWQDVTEKDFKDCVSQTMSTYVGWHMCEITPLDPTVNGWTDEADGLTDYQKEVFTDLMDYCSDKGLETIFVSFPTKATINEQKEMNDTLKLVEEYGNDKFKIVNMNTEDVYYSKNEGVQAELNIDWKVDFYGKDHVNSKGNIKTTKYLQDYILDNFELEDKRDNADYDYWETAYKKYTHVFNKGWEQAYKQSLTFAGGKVGGWSEESWNDFMDLKIRNWRKRHPNAK